MNQPFASSGFEGASAVHEATALRHTLHRTPEISRQEAGTALTIVRFLHTFEPDEIVENLGGHGVAAVYRGIAPGPTVLIRCELDALPIAEINDFAHRSQHTHISHKCGHDGHMAIVAGLAPLLGQQRPARGRVVLLFQPAEETGDGAIAVCNDPRMKSLAPDYCFALHNLPGRPMHEIVVREATFTMASTGMAATLEGRTSHASEPENGLSPVSAMRALLRDLPALADAPDFHGFTLVTLTHAKLGEPSFGIAPGRAEVLATLRAENDADLETLTQRAAELVASTAKKYGLASAVEWHDRFAAVVNDAGAVQEILNAADHLGLETVRLKDPIRWSEDFGEFTKRSAGALLGLGSGIAQPALHSPDYDFPDELIPTGIALFHRIVTQILGPQAAAG
jgi:amidohydrolase